MRFAARLMIEQQRDSLIIEVFRIECFEDGLRVLPIFFAIDREPHVVAV